MRVIAGEKRGTNLFSLEGDNTRPTTDKVKGAIFSMYGPNIYDESFLDLFSGSGAMGIEAASRGASKVVCVENNIRSVKIIEKNIEKTKLNDQIKVIQGNVLTVIEQMKNEKFDMIFMDPPYSMDFVNKVMKKIDLYDLLNEGGKIICEHDIKDTIELEYNHYKHVKSKKYGRIGLTVFGRK